jgi:hypothetical protein
LASRLPRAVLEACNAVTNDWSNAMRSSAHYVLQEFTGIDEFALNEEFKFGGGIQFGIPSHEYFMKMRGSALDIRADCVLL